jgi:hypothetical protein
VLGFFSILVAMTTIGAVQPDRCEGRDLRDSAGAGRNFHVIAVREPRDLSGRKSPRCAIAGPDRDARKEKPIELDRDVPTRHDRARDGGRARHDGEDP